jgi:MFS family permease
MSDVTCKSGLTEAEKKKLFSASFLALTAAGVGFVFRVMIPSLWSTEFDISLAEVGGLTGAALWPIAITMVLFSLLVDKIGYKISMLCAFALQALSVVLTVMADSYDAMWYACFFAGLGHGIVEAVINPLCASIYRDQKSKMLNILHASWPAGIVIGGLAYYFMIQEGITWGGAKWIFWIMLLPVAAYAVLFMMCHKFPIDERVEANVSNKDMLKEFGGLGSGLAITFLFYELANQLGFNFGDKHLMVSVGVGVVGGFIFGSVVGSKGKWLFFFLCLIMIPLATAEIATDGWIQTLMQPVLGTKYSQLAIVCSAGIMMILRFFAGVPLKFMSPPALLLLSSVFSIIGLFALSSVSGAMIFVAFAFYAVGQTFYWPTVLGFVAEQFPKGGAMTLNTVSAMGLLTVGIFGFPFLGAVQDSFNAQTAMKEQPALVQKVQDEKITFTNGAGKEEAIFQQKEFFSVGYNSVNAGELKKLVTDEAAVAKLDTELQKTGQSSLKVAAVLPGIMAVCFILMILWFKSQGGYKPVVLTEEEGGDGSDNKHDDPEGEPIPGVEL